MNRNDGSSMILRRDCTSHSVVGCEIHFVEEDSEGVYFVGADSERACPVKALVVKVFAVKTLTVKARGAPCNVYTVLLYGIVHSTQLMHASAQVRKTKQGLYLQHRVAREQPQKELALPLLDLLNVPVPPC